MSALEKQKSKGDNIIFWDELFRSIWAHLIPMLGVTNVKAMLEYARKEAIEKYPLLKEIQIRDEGFRLDPLELKIKNGVKKSEEVDEAIREYLATLIRILAQLTGEIVSRQVCDLIDKIEKTKAFKKTKKHIL